MEIIKFILNPFQVNAYILIHKNECVLIDMAVYSNEEYNMLTKYIKERELRPTAIINTHGHLDHICGNKQLKSLYNIPVYMHTADNFLVESSLQHAQTFGFSIEQAPLPDIDILPKMSIKIGEEEIIALHVPGHSPGSIAFYCPNDSFVITGDTLFAESIGRTDLPKGNYDTLISSIKTQLLELPKNTKVLPGHGSETSIEHEIENNPYLS